MYIFIIQNKSGYINIAEIKQLLDQGHMIEDTVWVQMIKDIDLNGDGEISYPEFEKMMEDLIGKSGAK